MNKGHSIFVGILAVWLVLTTSAVTVLNWPHPKVRAAVGMGWGLILLWIGLGGILMHCGREAVRLAPDWEHSHRYLGTALETQGKLDEAIQSYRRAIELDPGFVSAYYRLAMLYQQTGQRQKAAPVFQRFEARCSSPEHPSSAAASCSSLQSHSASSPS